MGKPEVLVYADGACSGNPGSGGWAALLIHPASGSEKILTGGEPYTTNQRMELLAVVRALEALKVPCYVVVRTDSQYVVGTMTQGWRRRAHADLWARLDELCRVHEVRFEWVRGHAGDPQNERVDKLARAAAAKQDGGGAAGRIITCRVGERVEADVKLQITRSRRGLVEGWTWEPLLAPPEDLFEDYLRWRARGEWPRRWEEYRRRFVVHLGARDVRLRLAELAAEVRAGKTVALACFCVDERWCHRSLVAERLRLLADGVIAR